MIGLDAFTTVLVYTYFIVIIITIHYDMNLNANSFVGIERKN